MTNSMAHGNMSSNPQDLQSINYQILSLAPMYETRRRLTSDMNAVDAELKAVEGALPYAKKLLLEEYQMLERKLEIVTIQLAEMLQEFQEQESDQ